MIALHNFFESESRGRHRRRNCRPHDRVRPDGLSRGPQATAENDVRRLERPCSRERIRFGISFAARSYQWRTQSYWRMVSWLEVVEKLRCLKVRPSERSHFGLRTSLRFGRSQAWQIFGECPRCRRKATATLRHSVHRLGGDPCLSRLAVLGFGGLAAFFSHPALTALAIATFVISDISLFSGGNMSRPANARIEPTAGSLSSSR